MNYNQKNYFDILEIKPTKDIRVVKKAYAKMTRKYHPEDNLEKYNRIREAYDFLTFFLSENTVFSVEQFTVDGSSRVSEEFNFVFSDESLEEDSNEKTPLSKEFESKNDDIIIDDSLLGDISRIANYQSNTKSNYTEEYQRYKDLFLIVSDISKGSTFCDEKIINISVINYLRRRPDYYNALCSHYFFEQYKEQLSKVRIPDKIADYIIEDIGRINANNLPQYAQLIQILQNNKMSVVFKGTDVESMVEKKSQKVFRADLIISIVVVLSFIVALVLAPVLYIVLFEGDADDSAFCTIMVGLIYFPIFIILGSREKRRR